MQLQYQAQRIKQMIEAERQGHAFGDNAQTIAEIRSELQSIAYQANAFQPIDSFPDIGAAMFYVFVSIIAHGG